MKINSCDLMGISCSGENQLLFQLRVAYNPIEATADYIIYEDRKGDSVLYGFHCRHHNFAVDKCSWNQEDVKRRYCHLCDEFYDGSITKSMAKRLKVQLKDKLGHVRCEPGSAKHGVSRPR